MIEAQRPGRRIPVRWFIGLLLFASTIINYLDRQTLSLLAPYLKVSFHWSNTDYANIIIAFRIAYTIGQTACGRFIDRVGTRKGLSISVLLYSLASIFTPLARGLAGFIGFRTLLGLGESANWPGATKAVSEWFPAKERGLATAFFDSGSSIGGAIAPAVVLFIYFHWGWRPAFIVPGVLGLLWLAVWRAFYHRPEAHPLISAEELALLQADREVDLPASEQRSFKFSELLRLPQSWAVIFAKTFTDPVWFFVGDWFPIYLATKGFELRGNLFAVWVPFLAADAGNFVSGVLSDYLIRRGWSTLWARKALVIGGALGTMCLIPTIFSTNLAVITTLFGLATFSYSCFATMAMVLASDLFQPRAVATVSGLSGTGAGVGTILVMFAVGHLTDARSGAGAHAFDPIMIACGLIPAFGMALVLWLLRHNRRSSSLLRETA